MTAVPDFTAALAVELIVIAERECDTVECHRALKQCLGEVQRDWPQRVIVDALFVALIRSARAARRAGRGWHDAEPEAGGTVILFPGHGDA